MLVIEVIYYEGSIVVVIYGMQNCHEYLYEHYEGFIVVIYGMQNCHESLYEHYEGSIVVLY